MAALVQHRAAGEVERQAQAEADAGLDLAHALEHLLGGEQVDAAELVVVAPVAPGRARSGALLSTAWSRVLLLPLVALYRPVGLALQHRFAQFANLVSASARRSAEGSGPMADKDFVVSADGHLLEPIDLFKTRLPEHLRDMAVWEEEIEIEPFVEGGARVFRKLHTPGLRGLDGLALPPDAADARPRAIPSSSSRTWTPTASTPRCCTPTCRSSASSPTITRCRSRTPGSTTTT